MRSSYFSEQYPDHMYYNYNVYIYTCLQVRKIMWLRVASSNNNPRFIASFYFQCVCETGGSFREEELKYIYSYYKKCCGSCRLSKSCQN